MYHSRYGFTPIPNSHTKSSKPLCIYYSAYGFSHLLFIWCISISIHIELFQSLNGCIKFNINIMYFINWSPTDGLLGPFCIGHNANNAVTSILMHVILCTWKCICRSRVVGSSALWVLKVFVFCRFISLTVPSATKGYVHMKVKNGISL